MNTVYKSRAAARKIKVLEEKRGRNRPLEEYRRLLDTYLPDHRILDKIQVAGTNGKGSTVLWLSQLLEKAGNRVGIFTSPHLISHLERMQINREKIEEHEWMEIYEKWEELFEKENFTMFETDLWMALDYFLQQGIDIAVIECGLGGRKDATTALDYQACLITSIGLDHQEFLGENKRQIALEKAGIFKLGVPAITAETDQDVLRVLSAKASRMHAPLVQASLKGKESNHQIYIQHGSRYLVFDLLRLPKYQLSNFALAYTTLKALEMPLDFEDVQDVIDTFCWPARFHQISAEPYILVDGAHNPQGIQALVDSLGVFSGDIFFSCLESKNGPAMIKILQQLDCPIHLVRFSSTRMTELKTLKKQFSLDILPFDAFMEDLKTRTRPALVCGSLYFAGEVLEAWSR